MKNLVKKFSFKILTVIGILIVSATVSSVDAQMLSMGYTFGPEVPGHPTSRTVALKVPARTRILNFTVTVQRDTGGANVLNDIPLRVEFFRPGASAAFTAQFPNAGAVQNVVPAIVIPGGFYMSQGGCPDAWRVRIRTSNGGTPPARIFGTVTVTFATPWVVNLDLLNIPNPIGSGASITKNLTAHDGPGTNSNLIAGTGTFNIKAKFDKDLTDGWHLLEERIMKVQLRRPDNSVAASDQGTPSQINFSYLRTAADANMSGSWKIKATNLSDGRVSNFDIENWPLFNSTFQASCPGGPSISVD